MIFYYFHSILYKLIQKEKQDWHKRNNIISSWKIVIGIVNPVPLDVKNVEKHNKNIGLNKKRHFVFSSVVIQVLLLNSLK